MGDGEEVCEREGSRRGVKKSGVNRKNTEKNGWDIVGGGGEGWWRGDRG